MLTKLELKKHLRNIGIPVIGNYVKKSNLKLALAKAKNTENTKIEDNEASLITFLEVKERTDTEMHDYANSLGMAPQEIEGIIYKIAHKALTGQYLKHWDDPDTDFDPDELAMGIKVEMEHTGDKHIATVIAKAHLSEIKNYYSRLKKMEKDAKK